MTMLWPFLALLVPLVLTLTGSRTAWIWLSAAAGILLVNLLAEIALEQVFNGDTDGALTGLVVPPSDIGSLSASTFTFIAHLSGISSILIPALFVAPFLFIPAHPRRTRFDIALFWLISALLVLANLAIVGALNWYSFNQSPPPNPNLMHAAILINLVFSIVAMALIALAIARPIRSWWRARKARHAL